MNRALALPLAALLAAPALGAETACVTTRKANVRTGPGLGYDVSWEAWRHTPFEVVERGSPWIRVRDLTGEEGYLHETVVSDRRTCVMIATKKANVRGGPGLDYAAEWVVDRDYPFLVERREGEWLRVTDSERVSGWIHSSVAWGLDSSGVS